ncbi:MAG: hypothetical protein J5612_06025 [Paludibacteraceae bacterium]|nr:hypothetical protein [Paludibacteraceae bacterium]
MARCTFADGIVSVWGAIDSVKEGQENRRRLVVRRHEYTENNYDEDGSKWHELFYYHFHEGAWSEGATRNREMIKAAQRTAHDIESKPELAQEREEWIARYAAYRATIPEGSTKYYHFYNYVYVTILREMRTKMGLI